MDITGPIDRDHDPELGSFSNGAVRQSPILGPLCDLMKDLSRARGEPVPPGREGEPPALWQDEKNVYMSFNILDAANIDVDINVCFGKAYIRVAR